MKTIKLHAVRTFLAAATVGAVLLTPAHAEVAAPVAFGIGSGDPLRAGQPATVHVVIRPAADFPLAQFRVETSQSWTVLDAAAFWTGALKANQEVTFTFRAVPTSDQPEPLHASLELQGFKPRRATLDPERMGGRFPERVIDQTRHEASSEEIHPVFESGVVLPEPQNATDPLIPGQAPRVKPLRPEPKNKSKNAGVFVRATGRFTYLDNNDVRQPVRFATVELINAAIGLELFDLNCANGLTDSDGNFEITDNDCGDITDGPDVKVRLVLNNNRVEVKPDTLFAGSYTFQTSVRSNVGSGTQSFGQITLSGTNLRRAAQTHNIIMRAQRFIADQGEDMPKVTVFVPTDSDHSFYTPVLNEIHVQTGDAFGQEGDIFHEYGHHILSGKAESPSPDYNNGNCDDPSPGHCIDQPENGVIAWTEGWPNFFGMYMLNKHEATDQYGVTGKYSFESFQPASGFANQAEDIEGVVAATLWDLVDSGDEDGTDRADMTFTQTWDVIKNFDPSGNIFHNHPTSLEELYEGIRDMYKSHINDVAQVYEQHNVNAPQPDLRVNAISNVPASVQRGVAFNVSNTIKNFGNEITARASTVRFRLISATTVSGPKTPLLGNNTSPVITVTVGLRSVAANLGFVVQGFDAGSQSVATTSLTVPSFGIPGVYSLQVCADVDDTVAESNEGNNCMTHPTPIGVL